MELTYTKIGDYYYPNLCLPPVDDDRPLGKYGRMRKSYLKEYCNVTYELMLLSGELDTHLRDINEQATELVDRMIADMAAREGVDEELKANDQMRWVGLMNNFKAAAEEVVLQEIVYQK